MVSIINMEVNVGKTNQIENKCSPRVIGAIEITKKKITAEINNGKKFFSILLIERIPITNMGIIMIAKK